DTIIVSATKGFDPVRHARMSELVRERFPQARVAALSGPTFAREVALGTPTAAVIAAADDALTSMLQARLGARAFRLYANRDLVLTATGTLSRNRSLGMALARGDSLTAASAKTRMVAEGVPTVRSALALARRHDVSLPICAEVAAVLFDGKPAADALASLLGR